MVWVVCRLWPEQKLDVARAQLEQVQKDFAGTERTSNRTIDTVKALLEQTDIRIADLKKEVGAVAAVVSSVRLVTAVPPLLFFLGGPGARPVQAYEFKRDVVVNGENFRTGKTMAEKVVRYMEEKLRLKDSVIEKLRLKNNSLKQQFKKLQGQLQQKQETGDVLHYIDFHQLQIENKQYAAKIEERTLEVVNLKLTTTSTVQTLNSLKSQLSALLKEVASLKAEIQQRSELLVKLRTGNKSVGSEITRTKRVGDKLKHSLEDTAAMPQVLDYLTQKATVCGCDGAICCVVVGGAVF